MSIEWGLHRMRRVGGCLLACLGLWLGAERTRQVRESEQRNLGNQSPIAQCEASSLSDLYLLVPYHKRGFRVDDALLPAEDV